MTGKPMNDMTMKSFKIDLRPSLSKIKPIRL